MSTNIVRSFFATYAAELDRLHAEQDHDRELTDRYALRPPSITESDLATFESTSALRLPAIYKDFLLAHSYDSLDLPGAMPPSMGFFATGDFKSLLRLNGDLPAKNVFAFAFDRSTDGKYCFDLTRSNEPGELSAVFFWRHGQATRPSALIGPLVSTFPLLLQTLVEFLEHGPMASHQPAEAMRFQRIDPVCLGDSAWREWWLPRLAL